MNAPTIIIGLGGTGSKITERVAALVTPEQRENIAFACFDTDINELKRLQKSSPFVKIIQTSTRQMVGEYLQQDPDSKNTWFPVNAILNNKPMTEGAAQVRSISRLSLNPVIRSGKMKPLHEAIQSLYKVEEDKADQALRVIIVSSLAGGTGSGLILPIAMYVRNYLKNHYRQSANITRGFFILPEVFHEVIEGQAERNNLSANAYATLRELDAFLMKGDHTLDKRYENSVKLLFPKTASAGYEEYDVRPYDFCFLFDAQNAEGSKLNSFEQYLDHAANCIYSQSIGPMNKRSNSSEDNTIRALAKEFGRNRYAGAGASRLVYPFEDILSLIAMDWTRQAVSRKWLMYDQRFREQVEENRAFREQGLAVAEATFESFYTTQIETGLNHGDNFAKAIHVASGYYKNGVTRQDDKWKRYVSAVMQKIEKDLENSSEDLRTRSEEVNLVMSDLGNSWDDYVEAYLSAKEYHGLSEQHVEQIAMTIAYSMFKGSHVGEGRQGEDSKLETYLTDSDGKFIHPNAVRYVLIKIKDLLVKNRRNVESEKREAQEYFDGFEVNTFSDPDHPEQSGDLYSLADRKVSLISRMSSRPSGEQESLKDAYRAYLTKTEDYAKLCAKSIVLKEGIEYFTNLIEAYNIFYASLDTKIEETGKKITELRGKYRATKGTTVRYVCASPECMDALLKKKTYLGSEIFIDDGLSRTIHERILEYALAKEKPGTSRFFSRLYDDNMIGYYKKSVMDSYGLDLDVDILTAVEKEAELLDLFRESPDPERDTDLYVRTVINNTRNLSCPFIESPLGEPRDPIYACTFNLDLLPKKGDDSPRAHLIYSELMNHGGEPDEDVPANEIMFYQSFYSLRANDLSKFAPPEKADTYNRTGGEYFKAYYDLVENIYPKTEKSRSISPHIDKWWHLVHKMPDLDEKNQKQQMYDINKAFFWAMVLDLIYRTADTKDRKIYRLRSIQLDMEDDNLYVSNGSDCDQLYEVLDAIAIYPALVHRINDFVAQKMAFDVSSGKPLTEKKLFRSILNFAIDEPGAGPDHKACRSIFDLPQMMKKSSIPEVYFEQDMLDLLRVILDETYGYLFSVVPRKQVDSIFLELVQQQYALHINDMKEEARSSHNLFNESLFEKSTQIIASALEKLEYYSEADDIRMTARELQRMEDPS